MSTFDKKPMCEICGENEAVSFSLIPNGTPGPRSGDWKYVCECTTDTEATYVMLEKFFKSPAATVDWLAHLHEKDWMDWDDFMGMMHRFRKATGSFGK